MILTKTNTQAKYQNEISYHLLLCFLEVHFKLMRPRMSSMILGGCFISEIVLNLSFR